MADIPRQLAALLGRQTVRIRKTDETPPRISVIDVISAISGHNSSNAARAFARLGHDYPDVTANCSHVKFPDTKGRKGQRDTPVPGLSLSGTGKRPPRAHRGAEYRPSAIGF